MAHYDTEREGQFGFYRTFLPLIDTSLTPEDVLADDNDGVLNGCLLEFKLRVNDLNAVLFQCIKYLSALRIKGKPVPASIVIVDLNAEQAYLYGSDKYLSFIERTYSGGASRQNTGFAGGEYELKLAYGSSQQDAAVLIARLKEKRFTRIHLDENCIVGWATSFYRQVPNARKEDFIGEETGHHKTVGEIRSPSIFASYIYPYTGATNVKFRYLMDRLNDTLQKKNLGAFYTPSFYAQKSHELLREALARVPQGNDYVIIDRCAGTGQLEKDLSDEVLTHCILSTVEYYEYKVLQELFGPKVRHIIPPIEADSTFNAGLVRGADALSQEYVENPVIKQYLDNPHCTVILFENPPFAETTSIEHQKKAAGHKSSVWKNSYVVQEMKKEVKGTAVNDLGNAFIWSAFKFYLRQTTDSYVVYSPVKYWKAQHLISKRFISGLAFNRHHFHTKIDACIMCALWANEEDEGLREFEIEGFDYDVKEQEFKPVGPLKVKRIERLLSKAYFDTRPLAKDEQCGVLCGLDGSEAITASKSSISTVPAYGENIIGYMAVYSPTFDNPDLHASLVRAGRYDGHGFYLRRDNYLEKLPLFCASRYITYNREWTERGRIMKSGDGKERFYADLEAGKLDKWLMKCLLFTCLEMQNHMRTFTGSDGRFYRNELCLDTSNGETLASKDLTALKPNAAEEVLLKQWQALLNAAKQTKEYDAALTYGVYQIYAEIDTFYKDVNGKRVWNNLEVHSALATLKALIKYYYNREIVPLLFFYEFLK